MKTYFTYIESLFLVVFLASGVWSADSSVCYGDLGCFTTASPWTSSVRPLSALPEDPQVINTQFLLNTRDNPTYAITLTADDAFGLYNSPFNGTKKTIFLIHGWTHDSNQPWVKASVSEILTNEDVNVFSVNWSGGSGLPYLKAVANTQVVGAEISKFILFLTSKTLLSLTSIHLIGHNLGAHVASYTGHRIYGLGRITGLDPATIYFEGGNDVTYLDQSDALFVDIIHSDISYKKHIGLGFQSNVGHVDILVNNGQNQPGCKDSIEDLVRSAEELVTLEELPGPLDSYVCSHMRSVSYFVESINSNCPFAAYSCSSWTNFQNGICFTPCRTKACTSMGYHSGRYEGRGVFYLDTQSSAPYCNTAIRVQVEISASQATTKGDLNYILIGDVGQTKEKAIISGSIGPGFIFSETISVPGSNPLRIGHVDAVRLMYDRSGLFGEKEVIVQKVTVQQANFTIDAVDSYFDGTTLNNGDYFTVYPTA